MGMATRLEAMGVPQYSGLTQSSKAGAVWTGKMAFAEKALFEPLRRKANADAATVGRSRTGSPVSLSPTKNTCLLSGLYGFSPLIFIQL